MNQFNTPEENALIAAAAAGGDTAFEKIVAMYEKLVYNTVRLKIPNSEDAMDLAQEIFIKLWRGMDKYRGDCKFSTWIYRISTNAALDFLRQNTHPETVPMFFDDDGEEKPIEVADESAAASPERRMEQNETAAMVREAIARLSADQREIVLLRDIQGYTYEEISEMLGLGIGTVKSRLNRARASLREMLASLSPELSKFER